MPWHRALMSRSACASFWTLSGLLHRQQSTKTPAAMPAPSRKTTAMAARLGHSPSLAAIALCFQVSRRSCLAETLTLLAVPAVVAVLGGAGGS
jgi:hypothetical protein